MLKFKLYVKKIKRVKDTDIKSQESKSQNANIWIVAPCLFDQRIPVCYLHCCHSQHSISLLSTAIHQILNIEMQRLV